MNNMTTIKIAKKYEGMIELIEHDSEGYWAYAREGYIFEDTDCRTAHEYTQKELLASIRTLVAVEVEEAEEAPIEETVVVEEEEAAIVPTVEFRKAGKKFKYVVTYNDGRTYTFTSNKDTHTHFVIATTNGGKQHLMSKHSRLDLAEKSIASNLGWEWCASAIIVEPREA